MSVRERIKMRKKKKYLTDYLVNKIIKNCELENMIEDFQMCEFEDCDLYRTNLCNKWLDIVGDGEYDEQMRSL